MAVINTSTGDTITQWLTDFNSLATFVGDITGLSSSITDATNPDTLVTAINYLYTLSSTETSVFENPVTFQDTLAVDGNTDFNANVTIDGTLSFNDTGSASVTTILDDDSMATANDTSLATSESIKAYVDNQTSSVNAATLDGIDSTSFLRSDANDSIDSDINVTIGSGAGSVRIVHNSTDNKTYFRPNVGSAGYSVADEFGFDSDNDRWFFDDELIVNGLFTTRGIDDNATSNVLQLETSSITLKKATTINGSLTLTTGDIIIPDDAVSDIGNNAGEYIRFEGSTINELGIYAGAVEGINVTATGVSLSYGGSQKLITTNTGVSITGDVVVSDDIFGPTTFDITNQAGEEIKFTGTSLDLHVNSTNIIGLTSTAIALNKNTTVTGSLDISNGLNLNAGNITTTGAFNIDNSAGEEIRFTEATIDIYAQSTKILDINSTGLNVTGDLDVSGTITGTLGNITLGDITTGTINSGAITSSSTLTLSSGDIVLPVDAAADIGNNAGEYVRFNGSSNQTEIRAGSDIGVLCTTTETQLRYNNSEKLATTNTGVSITGSSTQTGDGTYNTSDKELKELHHHEALDSNALDLINKLNPVAFKWNELSKELDPNQDTENIKLGLIAQEVEEILPEVLGPLVKDKYKTVNYTALIPVLINAIKELSEKVKTLKEENG